MTQKPCKESKSVGDAPKAEAAPGDIDTAQANALATARMDVERLSGQLKREREYREIFANEAISSLLAKYHCRLQVMNGGIQIIAE